MTIISRIAALIFMAALPVFIITTSVRFFAGDVAFYERGFRKYDADVRTGIPLSELDRAGGEVVRYFENDADRLHIVVNDNGEETSLYSTKEIEHMRDVKRLIQGVFRLNEISLAFVLAYVACAVLWSGECSLRGLAKLSLGGVFGGLILVGAIGALAVAGFDSAWTRFHEIAFQNDLWLLDPDTDRLIQMFPEPFWEEATFIVGGMIAAQALLIAIASTAYLLFSGGQPEEDERAPRPIRGRRVRAAR